jgi:hypothetical protein
MNNILGKVIEKGRAASKSPLKTFGYFLSMSQQAVSGAIIPNPAVEYFPQELEQRHKQLRFTEKLVTTQI